MRTALRWLLAVSPLFLAACGGGRANPNTAAAAQSCAGQQYVIVTNDWNEMVEIFPNIPDNTTVTTVGRLAPGERMEVPVPAGATGFFAKPARGLRSYDPPQMKQLVRFRYICK